MFSAFSVTEHWITFDTSSRREKKAIRFVITRDSSTRDWKMKFIDIYSNSFSNYDTNQCFAESIWRKTSSIWVWKFDSQILWIFHSDEREIFINLNKLKLTFLFILYGISMENLLLKSILLSDQRLLFEVKEGRRKKHKRFVKWNHNPYLDSFSCI